MLDIYKRPAGPRRMAIPQPREVGEGRKPPPAPVVVDRATECHVTPPGVALRMAQYLEVEPGQNVLEPSAGTGNLIQALRDAGTCLPMIGAVEQHNTLCDALRERFPRLALHQRCFLEFAGIVALQFDRVLMNPPFKTARKHVEAGERLLRPGGVLVALVPITFKRGATLEELPTNTFASAKVWTKIIRIDL